MEFIDEPAGPWSKHLGWKGMQSRPIEVYRVDFDDAYIDLNTKLYFAESGQFRCDIHPRNLTVPTLRGTAILASMLYCDNNSRTLTLDVRKLYGQGGISASMVSARHIPCDEQYLLQMAREVQNMPKIE